MLESVFYAWRITGDSKYQEFAWKAFQSLQASCKAPASYSSIDNVNSAKPNQTDNCESFLSVGFWLIHSFYRPPKQQAKVIVTNLFVQLCVCPWLDLPFFHIQICWNVQSFVPSSLHFLLLIQCDQPFNHHWSSLNSFIPSTVSLSDFLASGLVILGQIRPQLSLSISRVSQNESYADPSAYFTDTEAHPFAYSPITLAPNPATGSYDTKSPSQSNSAHNQR